MNCGGGLEEEKSSDRSRLPSSSLIDYDELLFVEAVLRAAELALI